jgi:hypothetical protein
VAELPRDAGLLERAHTHAAQIAGADPELSLPENTLLAQALATAYGAESQAPIRA